MRCGVGVRLVLMMILWVFWILVIFGVCFWLCCGVWLLWVLYVRRCLMMLLLLIFLMVFWLVLFSVVVWSFRISLRVEVCLCCLFGV